MTKLIKYILIGITGLIVAVFALLIFSPYALQKASGKREIVNSAIIEADPDSVFSYLGNSANASKWSVYVQQIQPLNPDSISDGLSGSRRRCYCSLDQNGTRWDETVTEVIQGKKRQLICYNFKNFLLTTDRLTTEQRYENQPDGTCRLTFSLFVRGEAPSWFETLKICIASYRIHSIFRQNVENVKAICECRSAPNAHE